MICDRMFKTTPERLHYSFPFKTLPITSGLGLLPTLFYCTVNILNAKTSDGFIGHLFEIEIAEIFCMLCSLPRQTFVVQCLAVRTGKEKVRAGESCFTTLAPIIRASFLGTTPFDKIDDGFGGWWWLSHHCLFASIFHPLPCGENSSGLGTPSVVQTMTWQWARKIPLCSSSCVGGYFSDLPLSEYPPP